MIIKAGIILELKFQNIKSRHAMFNQKLYFYVKLQDRIIHKVCCRSHKNHTVIFKTNP